MVRYEDQCVGCPKEMGCLGSTCPYMNVRILECDKCQAEVDRLYVVDGQQLCESCALDALEVIE